MQAMDEREGTPATPALPALLADTRGDLVDAIVAVERMIASLSAHRAELVEQARQWSQVSIPAEGRAATAGWSARNLAHRELVTELACALRIPERTAERLITDSETLVHELPSTHQALSSGEIGYRHAQVMADHAATLPGQARSDFERAALPFAKALSVAAFDRRARVLRERAHPETIATRQAVAVESRSVDYLPTRDGMAWLNAYLPAELAIGIHNRVTDIARALQGRHETRTLTQLRADAFAALLVDGHVQESRGIRARVLVTVPVLTLLGSGDEPASLEGYGPIDAETARRLAAHAPGFTRLLTHPESGAVLSVGRTRYAVPEDLRTWLRVRDETCRFPGCGRSARLCDVDHTDDWQHGGETRYDNLAHLCRSHHNVKHRTSWQLRQRQGGVMEWTSPAGRGYTTEAAVAMGTGQMGTGQMGTGQMSAAPMNAGP